MRAHTPRVPQLSARHRGQMSKSKGKFIPQHLTSDIRPQTSVFRSLRSDHRPPMPDFSSGKPQGIRSLFIYTTLSCEMSIPQLIIGRFKGNLLSY